MNSDPARRRCAFLIMDDSTGWEIDADLAVPPLRALGWDVAEIPWRRENTDWALFEAVYIGTPWDYPLDPGLFLRVLEAIVAAGAVLVNDIANVRWNLHKTYLRELQMQGVDIVPSRWYERFPDSDLATMFDTCGSDHIIIKPVVSTNASDTFLLDRSQIHDGGTEKRVRATFAERAFVLQPFIASIRSVGEFSLFYIGGRFSHAIRKTPKPNDFRVQEEHGAELILIDPDPQLRRAAEGALQRIEPRPVYARCDFVRADDGRYLVMEIELIEPSLYLRMQPDAAARFAAAFDNAVNERLLRR